MVFWVWIKTRKSVYESREITLKAFKLWFRFEGSLCVWLVSEVRIRSSKSGKSTERGECGQEVDHEICEVQMVSSEAWWALKIWSRNEGKKKKIVKGQKWVLQGSSRGRIHLGKVHVCGKNMKNVNVLKRWLDRDWGKIILEFSVAARRTCGAVLFSEEFLRRKPREYQRVQGSAWSHQMKASACGYHMWRGCRQSAWVLHRGYELQRHQGRVKTRKKHSSRWSCVRG